MFMTDWEVPNETEKERAKRELSEVKKSFAFNLFWSIFELTVFIFNLIAGIDAYNSVIIKEVAVHFLVMGAIAMCFIYFFVKLIGDSVLLYHALKEVKKYE